MTAMLVALTGAVIVLGGGVGLQRLTIQRLRTQRAHEAKAALLGHMRVDGLDLPLPTDKEWEAREATTMDGTKRAALVCRAVCISTAAVFAGETNRVTPPVAHSPHIQRYIDAVWREYRNRCVREAAP